jgi:hypothetical protein
MRRYAFIIAILGISIMVVFFTMSPIEIFSIGDLEILELNEKVILNGVIEDLRDFGDFKILIVNGIDVVCTCEEVIEIGDEIEVVGFVDEFEGERQIRVLEIVIV